MAHPGSARTSTSRPACACFSPSLAFSFSSSRLCFPGTFFASAFHSSFVDDFLCSIHFSYPVSNFVTRYPYDMPMQTDRPSKVIFRIPSTSTHLSALLAVRNASIVRLFLFLVLIFVYILYLSFESCSCSVIEALLLYSLSAFLCITIRAMTIYSP